MPRGFRSRILGVCCSLGCLALAAAAGIAEDESGAAASAAPGAKYRLAYKFSLNQRVQYEVVSKTEIKTEYNEQSETATNQSESRRSYRVTNVAEDGSAELELTIDWVRMTASFGKDKPPIEFQSDDESLQPPQFKHIMETIGKPTAVVQFDPSGRPVWATAKGPVAANKPATVATPANPDASQENYLVPLPEQPIAVDDTWKERFEVSARNHDQLTIKIAMQRTYKLKEVQNGRATIEYRTTILTPINDPALAAQLIQREPVGRVVFDIDRGMILARDASVKRDVIGPFGAKSAMHAESEYRERLLNDVASAPRPESSTR
jgi:hypothetical protein